MKIINKIFFFNFFGHILIYKIQKIVNLNFKQLYKTRWRKFVNNTMSKISIFFTIKDHQGLEDVEKIERMQEPLLRALRIYSRNRRPNSPVIYPKLLMKIYDLRTISMRGLYVLNTPLNLKCIYTSIIILLIDM